MRSKLINKEEKAREINYPCLMITKWYNGAKMVALFHKESVGTVVFSTYWGWKLGCRADSFNMAYFEPFDGTIELTNNETK